MLVVKKFGGSSVADRERIMNVARRCIEDYEKGNDVVVVLSAMGKTTDGLLEKAREITETPSKRGIGHAAGNGRAGIGCVDGHGLPISGSAGGIPQCCAGGDEDNIGLWSGKAQENRYGEDPQ